MVPKWFYPIVRDAIRIDEGVGGGGVSVGEIPTAWRGSPHLARIACWQSGIDGNFSDHSWRGLFAMSERESATVGGRGWDSPSLVQQDIAGMRWIWMLFGNPKAAWDYINRYGRFDSYPREGTDDGAVRNPFKVCPVAGSISYSDSLGDFRGVGGDHPHAGGDIHAPRGRAIRAPFDGFATGRSDDWFYGRYVMVTGANGYVRNAHVDRFQNLGNVQAGAVIGYVGSTGDAGTLNHDHFEWHPWVLPTPLHRSPEGFIQVMDAVDPFPFLQRAC